MSRPLTPDKAIVAAALEVLGSVSTARLKRAQTGKPQNSCLVSPFAIGRLANLIEQHYPGAYAEVRASVERIDEEHRAATRQRYAEQRQWHDEQMARIEAERKK